MIILGAILIGLGFLIAMEETTVGVAMMCTGAILCGLGRLASRIERAVGR